MEIKLKEILVRDVYKGYINNEEDGVIGYDGKLNIRPKYQREFVYKDKQRDEVINSINKDFPLNVMYWIENEDGNYEVLDGQQRTISICEYIDGNFSINNRGFYNLTKDEQEKILNYKLLIYFCKGTDKEIQDWFKIINIAGEKLTDQELRNAIYTGEWLTDAKRHFSKNSCVAYQIGEKYMSGSPIRQEYLETVLKWITAKDNEVIESYMSKHQHDSDANELWQYYQSVIDWVKRLFPNYRKEMKGLDWGILFNKYKDSSYNSDKMELDVSRLMMDDDVSNKKGIYYYLITGEEKYLNIRTFSDNQKREAYERQKGICTKCNKHFDISEMEGDHITPWHLGGKTNAENCQMLCRDCNRRKSGI